MKKFDLNGAKRNRHAKTMFCDFLLAIILLLFVNNVNGYPQSHYNFRRRNLFLDQMQTNGGDGIVYIDELGINLPNDRRTQKFLQFAEPLSDQIAMESNMDPKFVGKATNIKQFLIQRPLIADDNYDDRNSHHNEYQHSRIPPSTNVSFSDGDHRIFLDGSVNSHKLQTNNRFTVQLPSSNAMHEVRQGFTECPSHRHLLPCTCQAKGSELHIKCEASNLIKVQHGLNNLMKILLKVSELNLIGNSLRKLPSRFFGSLQVNKLILINNELEEISRNTFAGLESSIEHLYINEPVLRNLPFDTLDNLNNLKTFVLENTLVLEIPRLYSHAKLEFIKINGSLISSIPSAAFNLMTKMKKLQLSNSRIKEIGESALEGLIYLKELDLSNNLIEWIHPRAFRTMQVLEELNLSENLLTDPSMVVLPGREIRTLKNMDLSSNRITFLKKGTFVDMMNVEEIKLEGNGLSVVDAGAFSKMPNLRSIDLSKNALNELHADVVDECPHVDRLVASSNNISHVSDIKFFARTMPYLKYLNLDDNSIQLTNNKSFDGHENLEVLRLSANEIFNLSEGSFKNLPNLKELHLSHNRIQSHPTHQIWDLPQLKLLDISHNDLEQLNPVFLLGLPALRTLDACFNMISDIVLQTFVEVPELRSLNVSFNKLTVLPEDSFIALRDLYEIDLSFNELSEIKDSYFRGLSSLEDLKITHNQIRNIEPNSFRDTGKLKSVDLSTNILQQIPSSALLHLWSLRVLSLRRNAVNSVRKGDLTGLNIVERLDLSHNHIETLDEDAFMPLSILRDLDLSTNYIQSVHPNMFMHMKLLERVNLSHNFITDLGEKPFINAKRLRILDITNNSLTSIGGPIRGLVSLQGLYLSHNYINTLPNDTFIELPSLNVLLFDNNGLQQFEPGTFSYLSALSYLDLSNNNLVEINPDSFTAHHELKELKLNKNQISMIKDLSFKDLPSLQSLELQENVIAYIGDNAFDFMPAMKFLNLSKNALHDVPTNILIKMPGLDVLDLSWNFILEVSDSSFQNLEWLTVLMLHNNDLCRLSDNAFANQRELLILTLNNNQLSKLHLQAFRNAIRGLSLLDMSDNPFNCDCELVWLREFIEVEDDKIINDQTDSLHLETFSTNNRQSNFRKSKTRTIERYRDALFERAPLTSLEVQGRGRLSLTSILNDRQKFIDRYNIPSLSTDDPHAPLTRDGIKKNELRKDKRWKAYAPTTEKYLPMYLLGRSFSSIPGESGSNSLSALTSLPMPLTKIPLCAGPQKYKGMLITEVPADAFLCDGGQISTSSASSNLCVPRFLDPNNIGLQDLSAISFLDYNDPIVVPQISQGPASHGIIANITELSDVVTPPPLSSNEPTTTTIIVVTTTPKDLDVQVTQQFSQKFTSPNISQKAVAAQQQDYNVVTGDTPTIYAEITGTENDEESSANSGGIFSRLPSLPSILQTLGSISNLKLPNIGLNMNWGKLSPLGRHDTARIASKLGLPASDEDERVSVWAEGSNRPFINPYYTQNASYAIPSLPNAEQILPASQMPDLFIDENYKHLDDTDPMNDGRSSSIIFPQDVIVKRGPNDSEFIFPDELKKPDPRGTGTFVIPENTSPHIFQEQLGPFSEYLPERNLQTPAITHSGPGQSIGVPFLPGLTRTGTMEQLMSNHNFAGSPIGIGSVSKVSLPKNHGTKTLLPQPPLRQGSRQEHKKFIWSSPEFINPLSGVSLYQPNEHFKPYHPPNNANNPIKIITPPTVFEKREETIELQKSSPIPMNEGSGFEANSDILTYADPTIYSAESAIQVIPHLQDTEETQLAEEPDNEEQQTYDYYNDKDVNIHENIRVSDDSMLETDIPAPEDNDDDPMQKIFLSAVTPEVNDEIDSYDNIDYPEVSDTNTSVFLNEMDEKSEPNEFSSILELLFAAEKETEQSSGNQDFSGVDNESTQGIASHNTFHADRQEEISADTNPKEILILPQIDEKEKIATDDVNENIPITLNKSEQAEILQSEKLDSFSSLTPSSSVTQSSSTENFHVTTPSAKTQRPPTVYGNLKLRQPSLMSGTEEIPVNLSQTNVGHGVAVVKGKLSPDQIAFLDADGYLQRLQHHQNIQSSLISGASKMEETLSISGDNPYGAYPFKLHNLSDFDETTRRLPIPAVEDSLFQHNTNLDISRMRYGSKTLPSAELDTDIHAPYADAVRQNLDMQQPASISLPEITEASNTAYYTDDQLWPNISEDFDSHFPVREESNSKTALRPYLTSHSDEYVPEEKFENQADPIPASRLATFAANVKATGDGTIKQEEPDWYYKNYFKDYGNETSIPIGGNIVTVNNEGSSLNNVYNIIIFFVFAVSALIV